MLSFAGVCYLLHGPFLMHTSHTTLGQVAQRAQNFLWPAWFQMLNTENEQDKLIRCSLLLLSFHQMVPGPAPSLRCWCMPVMPLPTLQQCPLAWLQSCTLLVHTHRASHIRTPCWKAGSTVFQLQVQLCRSQEKHSPCVEPRCPLPSWLEALLCSPVCWPRSELSNFHSQGYRFGFIAVFFPSTQQAKSVREGWPCSIFPYSKGMLSLGISKRP